ILAPVVNVADVARELAPPGCPIDAPDEALVEAERRLVELALTNLLENARRHTKDGPRLVRVAREGAKGHISVVDSGEGVGREMRERIFDPSVRGVTRGAGTGLGLAIVRAVALRHGGVAEAREADGGGLDVGFSLGPVLAWHEEPPAQAATPASKATLE